jgi:hypothetical protein
MSGRGLLFVCQRLVCLCPPFGLQGSDLPGLPGQLLPVCLLGALVLRACRVGLSWVNGNAIKTAGPVVNAMWSAMLGNARLTHKG